MKNDTSNRKYKKILLIIITTFSLSFLSLNVSEIVINKESIRHLALDETKIDEICENAPKSVQEYYLSSNLTELFQLDEEKTYDNSYTQTLLDLLEGKTEKSNIMKYISRLIPFVIFIILGIISIFGWIVCCSCYCCPCCCCNQTAKNQYLCRLISFLLFMGMSVVVIGLSFYGLIDLNNIMKSLNGMSCTVFKLYTEVINGQETEITPKWTGVQNIKIVTAETTQTVDQIISDRDEIFLKKETLTTNENNFKTDLENTVNSVKTKTINVDGRNIIPSYVTNYYPVDKIGTTAYQIQLEFNQVIQQAEDIINDADTSSSGVVKASDTLKTTFANVDAAIDNINSAFDTFSDSIAEPWMKYQRPLTKYGKLGINIFFGILVGLSVLTIGFTSLFVILNLKCLKIFILIIWNIQVLIMILTFIIGGIFGLLGIIGKDGTNVVHYLTSVENLGSSSPRVIPESVREYVNICLNEDGDLSKTFYLDGTNEIQQLHQLRENLHSTKANLEKYTSSSAIDNNNDILTKSNLTFTLISEDIQTDYIDELNKNIKECNTDNSNEKVENNEKLCGGYIQTSFSDTLPEDSTKKCFLFSQWTTQQLKDRFKNCDTKENIYKFLDNIKSIQEQNSQIIEEIKEMNSELNTQFIDVINFVVKMLDEIDEKLIIPANQVLDQIGGDPKKNFVATLINCHFLGDHTKMIYTHIHDGLGKSFYNFAIIIETISCATALGVCFLIIVLNRYNKVYSEEKPKERIDTEAANPLNSEIIQINKKRRTKKSLEKGKIVIKKV